MHQLNESDYRLIKGNFVLNQRTSRLFHAKSCAWLFRPSQHTCQAHVGEIFSPF